MEYKKLTKVELDRIMRDHSRWLGHKGGNRALLSGYDLSEKDLSEYRLEDAYFSFCKLVRTNLSYVSLRSCSFLDCDLEGASLQSSSLDYAVFENCNLIDAELPSPTEFLQCYWGNLSDELVTELMRYDASNHPRPEEFTEWAIGGSCPFLYTPGFDRCSNFGENEHLWSPGPAKPARELVLMLFKEKNIRHSDTL